MTRHVLTGIDGSASSESAAYWAAGEAQRRGAPLRLLHAWPSHHAAAPVAVIPHA